MVVSGTGVVLLDGGGGVGGGVSGQRAILCADHLDHQAPGAHQLKGDLISRLYPMSLCKEPPALQEISHNISRQIPCLHM